MKRAPYREGEQCVERDAAWGGTPIRKPHVLRLTARGVAGAPAHCSSFEPSGVSVCFGCLQSQRSPPVKRPALLCCEEKQGHLRISQLTD